MAWGNSTGQAGLLKVPGINYGPQSFAVDDKDNKIYILDSTNQRILVFDTNGNFLSGILISENADDLCLGNKENIYVLYRSENKVVEYSFDGSVICTFPVANTASPVMGVYFNRVQGLFFETSEGVSYPLIKKETVISTPEAQIDGRITGLIGNRDSLLLERKDGQGIIKKLDFEENLQKEISVLKKDKQIETLGLIGIDGRHNIYISVEESTNDSEIIRYLRKYNQKGRLLAEAKIPYSNYVYTLRDLRVTRKGKVYQLLPIKEHVKVLVWAVGNTGLKSDDKSAKQLFSYAFPCPEDFLPGDPGNIDTKDMEIENRESFSSSASTSISRSEIISRAESYANHYFYVSSSNITSGYYCDGKTVESAVTSSGYKTGVLYKWGGFSGLTGVTSYTDTSCSYFYDEGLDAGKYAGDKNTDTTFGVCCAVGVDCSGFVSQTWGLSSKKSTTTLPNISAEFSSKDDLDEGDILIMLNDPDYGNHVRLFVKRETDGKYTVYEASSRDWKTSKYSYTASQLNSYKPYRYNKLSDAFQVNDKVQVISDVNIRDKACTTCGSTVLCTASTGNTGTVIGGPQDADGYVWWKISWDSGTGNCSDASTSGWSIEDCLIKTSDSSTACNYSLSSTSRSVGSSGGSSYSVSVTSSPSSCSWTATSNASWITITSGSSGSGNGTVYYSISSNTNTSSRTGTMTIAGQTFTVTQEVQATCTYSISPTNRSHGSGSETGSISVTTNSSICSWLAYSDDSWITITSGSSGTGDGTVYYSVSANTGSSSRTGTITIYGAYSYTFTVYQSGSCAYSLSSTSRSVGSGGGTYNFSVDTSSGCSWTATSNTSWLAITSGSSGSGDGTVYYSVSANTSSGSRTGTMTIAGKTFTVTQDGITTTTPTPTPTSTNTSFWTGNGSVIKYHGRLLSSNAGTDWPYGIERDVTMLHTSSGKPVGFFQWQVNTSDCSNLKIDAPTLSGNGKKVDITVGSWNTRENDKTFTNVQLPFTLGSSNIGTMKDGGWWVIAVAWRSNVGEDAYLDVECTDETPTSASSSSGNSVMLEGEYKWNGNGSIISHMFRSLANRMSTSSDVDWPYGAFLDVTKVNPSSEKPVVFFQWQVWGSGCNQLELDAPDLNSNEKSVNIEIKEWSNSSPQKVFSDVTLPFTITASNSGLTMSDGKWFVIKIEFLNPVSNSSTVEARCPGF